MKKLRMLWMPAANLQYANEIVANP